jgi:hypothetical protein
LTELPSAKEDHAMPTAECDRCGKKLSAVDLGARVKVDFGNPRYNPVRARFCSSCAKDLAKGLPRRARQKG